MGFDAGTVLALTFAARPQGEAAARPAQALVPMYTPMWYATKVMSTTAHNWWDGGVPPARRRGKRAADAVASAAVGVARRLQVVRDAGWH